MRTDKKEFAKIARALSKSDNGKVGPWSSDARLWCARNSIPLELQDLFETHMPQSEIPAGAGAIFDESQMIRWNDHFPEALRSKLLIVGSGPNGDHIVIDLNDGAVGYVSHEQDWRNKPRDFFVVVSHSIGAFLFEITRDPPSIPEDYWEALRPKL